MIFDLQQQILPESRELERKSVFPPVVQPGQYETAELDALPKLDFDYLRNLLVV